MLPIQYLSFFEARKKAACGFARKSDHLREVFLSHSWQPDAYSIVFPIWAQSQEERRKPLLCGFREADDS